MIHFGDITKLSGWTLPIVDVITGGSPCQDLSVAGLRKGLEGERSGLFMEQVRIVKEMRERDRRENGRTNQSVRGRYMVWENVPGAFSSNGGKDFQAVLTEIIRIAEPEAPDVPMPEKGGWPKAGCIYDELGNWSVAWRTHDAQYWGVPQRRKRICVLADFGGLTAPWVLSDPQFERTTEGGEPVSLAGHSGAERRSKVQTQSESLSGDSAESGETGEGTASSVGDSPEIAISFQERAGKPGGGKGILIQRDRVGALSTLNNQAVCYGISSFDSNAMKSSNPHSGIYEADTARTLDLNGGSPACNQGGMAVVCLNDQGGSNMDISEGVTGTLRAQDHGHPPLVMTIDPRQQSMVCQEDMAATLGANAYKEPQAVVINHAASMATFCKTTRPHSAEETPTIKECDTASTVNTFDVGENRASVYVVTNKAVYENHSQDSRYKELGDICQTVTAAYGMGGNNQPLVLSAIPVEGNGARPSHQGDGYGNDGDPSFTLNAVERHGVGIAIPINTMVGTRDNEEKRTCLGVGEDGDPQFTLSAAHSHAVCIQAYSLQRSDEHKESDKAHTLSARDYKDATDLVVYAPDVAKALRAKANLQFREDGETYVVAFAQNQRNEVRDLGDKSGSIAAEPGMKQQTFIASVDCRNGKVNEEVNGTLQAKEQGQNLNSNNVILIWPEVRRLTPLECTRLQGFPDGWLDIGDWTDEKGKAHKDADSPKYKAAGNSIALPFWSWLARRICAQYERPITMASLFDGIGGFPLAFERCGAKAVWASEIEPYPIAVTKKHFPEEQK